MDSPRTDIPNLPDDATALQALVLATLVERDALATERDLLLAQNDRLRHLSVLPSFCGPQRDVRKIIERHWNRSRTNPAGAHGDRLLLSG
jgi:hypothetical protein